MIWCIRRGIAMEACSFILKKADPFGKAEALLRAVSFFLMLYYFDQT